MRRVDLVDADTFAALVGSAAHVYGAAMQRGPELVVQRREIMHSHLSRQGFVAVTAMVDDILAGFGYGYRGRAGEWWHDVVAAALGRAEATRWLGDAFELAELHVLPDHQGQGLGRQLLEALLAAITAPTIVLSTHDLDSPARDLYRSVGFVDLLRDFVFPGSSEIYAIMGLEHQAGPAG
jgi:ribosomal protein S18 acetylase RimI-like enzyme